MTYISYDREEMSKYRAQCIIVSYCEEGCRMFKLLAVQNVQTVSSELGANNERHTKGLFTQSNRVLKLHIIRLSP